MMIKKTISFLVLLGLLIGCRGQISDQPPIHLNPNMDFQSKKKAQSLSREIPQATIPFGIDTNPNSKSREKFAAKDIEKYTGKNELGEYVAKIPPAVAVNYTLLERGQVNFNIYCAVCHDKVGTSQSVIISRGVGIPPPPLLASENVINLSDGQMYEIITYGIRNMPGYGTQIIEAEDRWAIIAYVRALQRSRTKEFKNLSQAERVEVLKNEE